MSDYVLVSQGVEIARSLNPYEIIAEAIKTNREWNKYVEKCIENCERYADNECFVYKEERDKTTEVDLFEFEHFLKAARDEIISEINSDIKHEIEYLMNCGMGKQKSLEHLLKICDKGE